MIDVGLCKNELADVLSSGNDAILATVRQNKVNIHVHVLLLIFSKKFSLWPIERLLFVKALEVTVVVQ